MKFLIILIFFAVLGTANSVAAKYITLEWDSPDTGQEVLYYNLYTSPSPINKITGKFPKPTKIVVPNPLPAPPQIRRRVSQDVGRKFYAVTAVYGWEVESEYSNVISHTIRKPIPK